MLLREHFLTEKGNNRMKKLCIFDLDGTLVNSLNTIAYYGNLALDSVGLPSVDTEKYRYFVGNSKKTLLHRLLNHHNCDNEEIFARIEKVYDENYEADTIYLTDAYDGIRELIDELKNKGILLAVCSNKSDNVVKDIVKILFGDKFDVVIGQCEDVAVKPAPDSALNIVKELGVSVEDCLFIGDTNVDIRTAQNANIKSVGVLWGFRDEAELKEANADVIVAHPMEILEYID